MGELLAGSCSRRVSQGHPVGADDPLTTGVSAARPGSVVVLLFEIGLETVQAMMRWGPPRRRSRSGFAVPSSWAPVRRRWHVSTRRPADDRHLRWGDLTATSSDHRARAQGLQCCTAWGAPDLVRGIDDVIGLVSGLVSGLAAGTAFQSAGRAAHLGVAVASCLSPGIGSSSPRDCSACRPMRCAVYVVSAFAFLCCSVCWPIAPARRSLSGRLRGAHPVNDPIRQHQDQIKPVAASSPDSS